VNGRAAPGRFARAAIGLTLLVGCGGAPPSGGETESHTDAEDTDTGAEEGDSTSDESDTSAGSESTGDGDSGDGDGMLPYPVDAHTTIESGRLVFDVNVPIDPMECASLPHPDPPCDDDDDDGVVDVWELLALQRLRPIQRMDEAEQLFGDASAVQGGVGRVTLGLDGNVRIFIMLGYSRDYGSCGFTAHNGDSERVVMSFAPDSGGSPGRATMVGAYTAAHEGTATDGSRVFTGADLDELVLGEDPWTAEPRWVVFPSADKHATYATIDICESVSIIPCFDEDCAPDGVSDPDSYDLIPDIVNAGEPGVPFVTELSGIGFPGEQAWEDVEFCGGLGGGGCSSSVLSKLMNDPF
jgi:hypothetical protein